MIESLICDDAMFTKLVECGMIQQVEDEQTTYDGGQNSQPQMADYLKQSGNDLDKVVNDLGEHVPQAVIVILSEDGMDANAIADSFSFFNTMSTTDDSPKPLGSNDDEERNNEVEPGDDITHEDSSIFAKLDSIGNSIANPEAKGFNVAKQMIVANGLEDYANQANHQYANKLVDADKIGQENV